jgi:transposase-like protein
LPRVRGLESSGGSGLLVNEELVRAIQTESAAALAYWFGVSAPVVWRWRQAFGVSGTATTPGSAKAHREVCKAAAAVNKTQERTDEELDPLAEAARRRNQARYLRLRWTSANGGWTKKELALLGTDDDEAVAKKLGRTVTAVRGKRLRLKIRVFRDQRKR